MAGPAMQQLKCIVSLDICQSRMDAMQRPGADQIWHRWGVDESQSQAAGWSYAGHVGKVVLVSKLIQT